MLEDTPPTEKSLAALRASRIDLELDPEFVAGYLKAQFVEDIYKAMEEQHLNRSQLAEKLGKTRQYVGRVLNENANFTLETLAEIACALGMHVAARMFSPEERMAILPVITKPRALVLADFVEDTQPVHNQFGGSDDRNLAA
jgi:transcriptional regulator with XRE-family HTH domain